jgi:hypothetical protein
MSRKLTFHVFSTGIFTEKPAGVIIDFSHIADIDTSTVQVRQKKVLPASAEGMRLSIAWRAHCISDGA